MIAAMLGLLAETPVHPGSGRGLGVVDLPVAREAATGYPVIVGSSLKGALRDKAENIQDAERRFGAQGVKGRFGEQDRAGDLLVSDARLLLLPVRSLTSSYRWATCPHLLERYGRDLIRAGLPGRRPAVPNVERGAVLASGADSLYLEERQFSVTGPPDGLSDAISPVILHEDTRQRLESQIAVLHDDDFAWFARYGLSIQARNALEDGSKQSGALWYEETLPPDTLMYSLIVGRNDEAIAALDVLFPNEDPYLQAGGNETVGQGWFAVSVRRAEDGGSK